MKDNIADLAKALVQAQAEMKNPAFDSKNPHFKSKFASLASVRNAVIPCFNKHGVFVTQSVYRTQDGVACVTHLLHESGQWISYPPLEMPLDKANAQGVGSASTYAKRYALQAAAGVVGDEDDDGNAASEDPAVEAEATDHAIQSLADRFTQAAQVGLEQAIYDLHVEAGQDKFLYQQAWNLLTLRDRKVIKEAIKNIDSSPKEVAA